MDIVETLGNGETKPRFGEAMRRKAAIAGEAGEFRMVAQILAM